jgi:hypothetical protein
MKVNNLLPEKVIFNKMDEYCDIEFKTCKDCKVKKTLDDFYVMRSTYSASCKKCCIARNRENYLKSDKYLNKEKRTKAESKVKVKKVDIKKELLLKEVTDFIQKIEKQRLYIDGVDVYRLVSLGVDIDVKVYENISIEDELILTWSKLLKWVEKNNKENV